MDRLSAITLIRARQFRRQQTDAELFLWHRLREAAHVLEDIWQHVERRAPSSCPIVKRSIVFFSLISMLTGRPIRAERHLLHLERKAAMRTVLVEQLCLRD